MHLINQLLPSSPYPIPYLILTNISQMKIQPLTLTEKQMLI